jgi:uracil-DNA glycosylase
MDKIKISRLNTRRLPIAPNVKLIIVGLTPGAQQEKAINNANQVRAGAFAGAMRKNIHQYMLELGICEYFKIISVDEIYDSKSFESLVYFTSLLREPVYIYNKKKGKYKNYAGRSPYPWDEDDLKVMMDETLTLLEGHSNALIIPMGDIVSKAIIDYSTIGESNYVLHGFPHCSPLNGHRQKKFEEAFTNLSDIFKRYKMGNT